MNQGKLLNEVGYLKEKAYLISIKFSVLIFSFEWKNHDIQILSFTIMDNSNVCFQPFHLFPGCSFKFFLKVCECFLRHKTIESTNIPRFNEKATKKTLLLACVHEYAFPFFIDLNIKEDRRQEVWSNYWRRCIFIGSHLMTQRDF